MANPVVFTWFANYTEVEVTLTIYRHPCVQFCLDKTIAPSLSHISISFVSNSVFKSNIVLYFRGMWKFPNFFLAQLYLQQRNVFSWHVSSHDPFNPKSRETERRWNFHQKGPTKIRNKFMFRGSCYPWFENVFICKYSYISIYICNMYVTCNMYIQLYKYKSCISCMSNMSSKSWNHAQIEMNIQKKTKHPGTGKRCWDGLEGSENLTNRMISHHITNEDLKASHSD